MQLPANKKIFFASDFHLGLPDMEKSRERELLICKWLDEIKEEAHEIYLVGDLFDVWFEYKNVIPKGYIRFLGKLAELRDAGIHIEVFTGNHDLWMNGYFEQELNIKVNHQPIEFERNGKLFFVGHGDGLGPGDHGYKFLKSILNHPIAQWLYRRIHPDSGIALANYFSKKGDKHSMANEEFLGEDKEWLILFCKDQLKERHIDYFIFGHRHLALYHPLPPNSLYLNLGDWLTFNSYAEFDGNQLNLHYFKSDLNE